MNVVSIDNIIENLLDSKNEFLLSEVREAIDLVLEKELSYKHRFHHSFFYEIRPLFTVAKLLDDECVKLRFCSVEQEYDGEIIFSNNALVKVELTRAVDGYNESLTMQLLEERGDAPAFQKIEYSGSKHNRSFGVNVPVARCVKTDGWYQEIEELITIAYTNKMNGKYQGYWLIITFDDWKLQNKDDKHYFNIPCKNFWEKNIKNKENLVFQRIFIVGDSGKFIWDSNAMEL